jgi:peroxiredoxin
MKRGLVVLAVALVLSVSVPAGQYNKKVSIGDAAPTFTGLEGTDGKKHSLGDFKKDVVVVAFLCPTCVTVAAYEERVVAFAKKYGDKVDLVAINVNNSEDDRLPKMTAQAKEKGFTFAYLYDPSQKIARSLGASVTPEFFVLDKNRKITYMGRLDDDQEKPTVNYLHAAVDATLAGTPVVKAETRPFGCGIDYDSK